MDAKNHQKSLNTKVNEASPASLKHGIRELLSSTTMHAVPNIIRAQNLVLKLIWSILLIVSFAYSVYSVVLMVINFLEFKVLIRYEVIQDYEYFEFPAVTICNINPLSDIDNQTKLDSLYSFLQKSTKIPSNTFLVQNNKSICAKTDLRKMTNIVSNDPNFHSYGMSLDRMLISCYYNDKPCNIERDFMALKTGMYGTCYSFNKKEKPHIMRRTGLKNGLQLEIFLGENEIQPCFQTNRGLIITIDNKTSKPIPGEEGQRAHPGHTTNFILSHTDYNKLNSPYSNCILDNLKLGQGEWIDITIKEEETYTQKYCMLNCAKDFNKKNRTKYCVSINDTSLECQTNIDNLSNYYPFCSEFCPMMCKNSWFDIVPSSSAFPSLNYANHLISNSKFVDKFTFSKNIPYERMRENILSVNIYFSSANKHIFNELPETDFSMLLSNLGGQLGLFLGVSLLSIFEVLDIIFLLIQALSFKIYPKF
jgi:hypothetical protein